MTLTFFGSTPPIWEMTVVMTDCVACEEVEEMRKWGYDDYFCRKHDKPIYTTYPASKHVR